MLIRLENTIKALLPYAEKLYEADETDYELRKVIAGAKDTLAHFEWHIVANGLAKRRPAESWVKHCQEMTAWCNHRIDNYNGALANGAKIWDEQTDLDITLEEWERLRGFKLQHHLDFLNFSKEFWANGAKGESK